jgi:very-short-patch-repair endonuclease
MSKREHEIGDRFTRYEEIAHRQDEKRARDHDKAKSTLMQVDSLGDAVTAAITRIGGADPDSIENASGRLALNIEMAARKATRHASGKHYGILTIQEAAKLCDSPIERSLLPWLVYANYGDAFEAFPVPVYDFKGDVFPALCDIFIVPQFAFVKYRADFGIVAKHKKQTLITVVECDGDSYHTARRDTIRDGVFASFGVRTFRANGSEIRLHADAFAQKIGQYINDWALQL